MSEEKKEEKVETKPQAPEAPKAVETQAAEPKQPDKQEIPQTAEAKPAEKKPAVKKEKPANCAGCNKSIRKKRWYYRDGKFYCTKRCWQTTIEKEKAQKDAAQSPEAKPQA